MTAHTLGERGSDFAGTTPTARIAQTFAHAAGGTAHALPVATQSGGQIAQSTGSALGATGHAALSGLHGFAGIDEEDVFHLKVF